MAETLPLSLCVITRDAADELPACLRSAAFAADVVVVDSGSRDDTVETARRLGARVVEHPWQGFGPQKQFAVASAQYDWVLCLDADERVTPELAAALAALFRPGPPPASAYAVARRNRFLGRWLTHGEGYPDWNLRFFDRRYARWSNDVVHERVIIDGAPTRLAGDLLHESAESLTAYVAKQNRYTTIQAEALYARGQDAGFTQIALAPLARFLRLYVFRLGFLDGAAGFAHIAVGAFASFLKYAKLRALNANARTDAEAGADEDRGARGDGGAREDRGARDEGGARDNAGERP